MPLAFSAADGRLLKTCSSDSCPRGGAPQPADEAHFGPDARRGDGLQSQCRLCTRAAVTAWRATDWARYAEKAFKLDVRHGMSPEEFDNELAAQGGRCAICGTTEPGGHGGFHVDHDHDCCPAHSSCFKCRRGLLCSKCNFAVGTLEATGNYVGPLVEPAIGALADKYITQALEIRLAYEAIIAPRATTQEVA